MGETNNKKNVRKKMKELIDMAVMSKPVNLAFVVREDKADEFINSKSSAAVISKIKKQAREMMKHSTFNGQPWGEDIRKSLED